MLRRKIITAFYGLILVTILMGHVRAQAQSGSCELVNNQDRMLVFFAPMYAFSQLKDMLPKDTPYTVIGDDGDYLWIEYGSGERGWVDHHTRMMNGDCAGNPRIVLPPLSDFPTVCFYTTTEDLAGYRDAALTQEHSAFSHFPPGTYPIVSRTSTTVEFAGTADMGGAFVEANHGTFSGHCDGTLQLATTLDGARVWTEPDVSVGQMIATLDAGTEVGILEGPVQGRILADDALEGNWYKIAHGAIVGWIWEERLKFGRTFTVEQPYSDKATALDSARLWTQPDIRTGQVVTTLLAGSEVQIIGDTVEGVIREDPVTQGMWVPVQQGGTTGWVLAARLEISGGND